jgi:Asp/Glu/hydantoin racemase
VVAAGLATYHLVYQLAGKYAAISVNEALNPVFLRAIKEAGCHERMTSMRAIGKPLKLPMEDFYTPDELEEEILRIARKQVEEEGAQVVVIACTVIFLFLNPGARERLEKNLGVIVVDLQAITIRTAEMLVSLGLSHSNIEYPQADDGTSNLLCCTLLRAGGVANEPS